MNLKEAAAQLGAHYQTVYKWVRSGELTAVRVGGRYDVSPAAVERFRAGRRAVLDVAPPLRDRRVTDLTTEDVLEELEAMASDPFVSAGAAAALAARRGTQVIGDLCLVVCSGSGGTVLCDAADHPDPHIAAFVAGAVNVTNGRVERLIQTAFSEQRAVRIARVPQDQLRRAVGPEMRQHLATFSVHSLLAAPIVIEGESVGVIVFTRDEPGPGYSDAEERFVVSMAKRVGALFETARDVERAWNVRRVLVERLGEVLARGRGSLPSRREFEELLRDSATSGLPVAILDADSRFVAVNAAIVEIAGRQAEEYVGKTFELFTHPEDRAVEQAYFERFATGELDFLDVHARRMMADGTDVAYASHRAAIRDGDATLRCTVTVARPLHIPTADYAAAIARAI